MCRWKIIERYQFLSILDQAPHRFGIFVLIGVDEVAQFALRLVSGCYHPDLVQVILRVRLHRFRQRVGHVGLLCTQNRCWRVCGYTSSSVAHSPTTLSPSATLGVALFQIQPQFVPPLGRFSHSIADRQQLLLTLLVDADQHQHTKFHILAPQATVDAVRPHVQVHIRAQSENLFLFNVNAGTE